MHMVEAFLAAGDATGDPVWPQRALRIAERLIRDSAGAQDWRVVEHFDERWRPLPDYNADEPADPFRPFGITPGHGLEWARLLLQVRSALPAPPGWLLDAARGLFARATEEGWQAEGGFVYTTDHEGRPVVTDRMHWVVTEAIGAAAVLHADDRRRGVRALVPDAVGLRRAPPDRPRARQLARGTRRVAAAQPPHLGGQARRVPRPPGHADPPAAGAPEPRRGAAPARRALIAGRSRPVALASPPKEAP